MLSLICKLEEVKHQYHHTIILSYQQIKYSRRRGPEYHIGKRKGKQVLQTKIFVSEFCLRSHLRDILSGREHPRQEGSPDVIQFTSRAASAVPCPSTGNSQCCPSLPFRDAHLISELALDCEQWSFCLRLVDIRLELFQGNSWNMRREKQNEKSEKKANFFFSQHNVSFSTGGNNLVYQ